MQKLEVVIDTNVLLSALRSSQGKSYKLIFEKLFNGEFIMALSAPVVLEYEEILKDRLPPHLFSNEEIDEFIDALVEISHKHLIYFLWRPFLKDNEDDHILELALSAKVKYIITFNVRDFSNTDMLGIYPITPQQFLQILEEEV